MIIATHGSFAGNRCRPEVIIMTRKEREAILKISNNGNPQVTGTRNERSERESVSELNYKMNGR